MRVWIRYPHLPRMEVEVEGDPAECCALLLRLGEVDSGSPDAPAAARAEPGTPPPGTPTPGTPPPGTPPPGAPTPGAPTPRDGRLYRGKLNRRQMVIRVFEELERRGRERARLEEIKTCFSEMFPEENTQNLTQVVRDLANKTEIIERCEWGTFRLS